MNILITNDDGIRAPGIRVLARAASHFGTVTVVAPASQCSAMSHRIILDRPMAVRREDLGLAGVTAYSVDSTPADCVRAAVDALMPQKPDVVLSGINHGWNVGFDIVYSGTVSAAMEALLYGIPAIALSQDGGSDYAVTEAALPPILERLLAQAPSGREVWNVNFPRETPKGILWDRTVARDSLYTQFILAPQEADSTQLEYTLLPEHRRPLPRYSEDSDLCAVLNGYISVGKVLCPVL